MKQEATTETTSVESLVGRLAGFISHGGGALGTGDVAVLRRMDPRHLDAPFFKLAGLVLDEQLPGEVRAREAAETRWAAIIVGLAHLGELHRPAARLGTELADAGLSELRFSRLLRADANRLVDELPALARFLRAKSVAVNWGIAAKLILSAGQSSEERERRNLARDYFAALARKA